MSESIDISEGFVKAKIIQVDTDTTPTRYLLELSDESQLWVDEDELEAYQELAKRILELQEES